MPAEVIELGYLDDKLFPMGTAFVRVCRNMLFEDAANIIKDSLDPTKMQELEEFFL